MIEQWEVWLANFVFEDSDDVKQRPVLILSDEEAFPILVAKVTKTPPRNNYIGEYSIVHWKQAGLNYPSTIRLSKRLLLQKDDFVHKLGRLEADDIRAVQKVITAMNK